MIPTYLTLEPDTTRKGYSMWRNPKYFPAEAQPGRPAGRKLASLLRGPAAELRITLETLDGNPFVKLQAWSHGPSGWAPKGSYVTVRMREIADVVDALRSAPTAAALLEADDSILPEIPQGSPVSAVAGQPPWRLDDADLPY